MHRSGACAAAIFFAATATAFSAGLVDAVNARDAGAPGWRRVRVDIVDGGRVSRSFLVVNLWRRDGVESRMLFLLEAPEGLAGTSYLEIERAGAGDAGELEVFLSLPTSGGRVLTIREEDLGDGLLGSDFTYADLRMLLPRSGVTWKSAGASRLEGRAVTMLDGVAHPGAPVPWQRARFYIDPSIAFVVGVDYFAGSSAAPVKRMRVERMRRIDGVWTAEEMTMTAAGGRLTRITLLEARFHQPHANAAAFEPAALPNVRAMIGGAP